MHTLNYRKQVIMGTLSLFCFIAAAIVVVTKLILEYMEEKDRAMGIPTNHEEYTMFGLVRVMWREAKLKIKIFFKKLFKKDISKDLEESIRTKAEGGYNQNIAQIAQRPGYKEKQKKQRYRNKTKKIKNKPTKND